MSKYSREHAPKDTRELEKARAKLQGRWVQLFSPKGKIEISYLGPEDDSPQLPTIYSHGKRIIIRADSVTVNHEGFVIIGGLLQIDSNAYGGEAQVVIGEGIEYMPLSEEKYEQILNEL